jgi:hypothetical protein
MVGGRGLDAERTDWQIRIQPEFESAKWSGTPLVYDECSVSFWYSFNCC